MAAEAQRHRAGSSSLRLCTTHVQLLALARRFHAAALRSCSRGDTASTAKASVFLREAQGFLKSRRARFQKRRSRTLTLVAAEPRWGSAAAFCQALLDGHDRLPPPPSRR